MDIIIPISILITMALVKLYQILFLGGEEIAPETYSQEEKDSAVNALAISLLLTRDHLRFYERKSQQSKEKKRRRERGKERDEEERQSGKATGDSTPFTPAAKTLNSMRNRGGKTTTPTTNMTAVALLSNEMHLTDIYGNSHNNQDDRMKNQNSPMSRRKKNPVKHSFNESEAKDNKDNEDDDEEETEEIQILRQENHLYRKVIYPFLKILSDDSSYHSNAHNLKKVLDFMQPPSSDEDDDEEETENKNKNNKNRKRKPIGINAEGEDDDHDPESAYSAIATETKKDKNKETDYLLRLSRDLIDEEDEKKRRQKELQLLPVEYNPKTKRFSEVLSSLLPHPTVSLTSSSARKGEKVYSGQYRRASRSDAVSETNSQPNNNNDSPTTAVADMDAEIPLRRNMIIVNKLSASPSSMSSNKSSKMTNNNNNSGNNYIIRGKEDILKKLKELIFVFKQYSDSSSHGSPSSATTTDRKTLQAVKNREETFQLTNSLLLMDESSLGSNEEDLVEYYQCLYELLLIHVLLLVNNCSSSSSFDEDGSEGGGSTKEPPVQRMFYQVGGGISRNGVLKDKVSYYSLQDLHARIHCLTS
jgi:hypothetical protein